MKHIQTYENLFGGLFDSDKTKLIKYVEDEDFDKADKMYDKLNKKYWDDSSTQLKYETKRNELKKIYPRRYYYIKKIDKTDNTIEEIIDDIPQEKSKPDMKKATYDLVFEPSGEVMEITDKELDAINDTVEIDYNKELDAFTLDDQHRYVITFLLKK